MSLQDKIRIIPRRLIKDERGWFFKAITGTEAELPSYTGEVYLTMGTSGQIKGGHYHPKALEWFTVIEGFAILRLKDINTGETLEIPMSLNESKSVFVPNYIAHEFMNVGDDNMLILAYTDRLYDPEDTIKYNL